MPALNHVHQYMAWKTRKVRKMIPKRIQGEPVFKCNLPGCTHYLPYSLCVNKYSLCPGCGKQFVLTISSMEMAFPRCLACRKTKEAEKYRAAQQVVDSILAGPLLRDEPKLRDALDPDMLKRYEELQREMPDMLPPIDEVIDELQEQEK